MTEKGHAQQNIPDSRRLQSTELSALAAEMNLATKPRLLSIESSFGTSLSKSDSRVSWSFAFASVVCLRRLKSGPRYRHVLRRGHVRISKPLFIEKMGRAKASPSVTIQCAARRWLACIEMHNQAKLRTLQARREHCSLIQLIRVRQMAVDTAQKTARKTMSRSSAQQHSEYTNALAIYSITLWSCWKSHPDQVASRKLDIDVDSSLDTVSLAKKQSYKKRWHSPRTLDETYTICPGAISWAAEKLPDSWCCRFTSKVLAKARTNAPATVQA